MNLYILLVEVGSSDNEDGGKEKSVFMCKRNLLDHTRALPHNSSVTPSLGQVGVG
jgi:hypothetical protein